MMAYDHVRISSTTFLRYFAIISAESNDYTDDKTRARCLGVGGF